MNSVMLSSAPLYYNCNNWYWNCVNHPGCYRACTEKEERKIWLEITAAERHAERNRRFHEFSSMNKQGKRRALARKLTCYHHKMLEANKAKVHENHKSGKRSQTGNREWTRTVVNRFGCNKLHIHKNIQYKPCTHAGENTGPRRDSVRQTNGWI